MHETVTATLASLRLSAAKRDYITAKRNKKQTEQAVRAAEDSVALRLHGSATARGPGFDDLFALECFPLLEALDDAEGAVRRTLAEVCAAQEHSASLTCNLCGAQPQSQGKQHLRRRRTLVSK